VPQSLDGPSLNAVTSFDLNNLSTLALAPAGTPQYKTTYGNFAPRVGIAYQLSQNQRWQTVLRGGFGVFYDLASSEAGNQIGSYYPYGNTVLRFGGTYPLSSAQATPPPITIASLSSGELFAFDPNLKLPYTLQWNFAFEQGLGKEQTLSASYIGSAGRRLLNGGLVASPNPSFGFVGFEANVGTSDYDALQIQFQRRLSHRLQALASYTWAHSIDTGSAGSSFLNSNKAIPSTIPNSNRGPSDFDIRHAFSTGLTVDIPAPKINAFANAILHNWSLQTLILANSAGPDDISDANFFQFNGGVQASARPDLVPGQPLYLYGSAYPGGKAFNPAAFTHVPADPNTGNPIRQGDVSRNFLRGFGATQWDFSVHREFPMHESVKMQFRAEMFNVLNHPNFGQPNGSFGSGGFGKSTQMLGQYLNGGTSGSNLGGGGFSPLYQIGGPRSVQFALKLMF